MNILIKEPEQRREEARTDCSAKKELNSRHFQQCCGTDISKKERGLNREWIEANCRSVNIGEATELLRYPARSGGIAIEGANGQFQLRPDKPWGSKPGKLHSHSPGFRFTWQLPRDYTIFEAGWRSIDNWSDEATQGNSEYKELLLPTSSSPTNERHLKSP